MIIQHKYWYLFDLRFFFLNQCETLKHRKLIYAAVTVHHRGLDMTLVNCYILNILNIMYTGYDEWITLLQTKIIYMYKIVLHFTDPLSHKLNNGVIQLKVFVGTSSIKIYFWWWHWKHFVHLHKVLLLNYINLLDLWKG